MGGEAKALGLQSQFDHELLELFRDRDSGLTGVIAVHSTALGPAMGGLRIVRYPDLESQMVDACRLARAMTLKNAVAGLKLGGGKAALLDDGAWGDHRESRLIAFSRALNALDGRYITAEDVGTTPADMQLVSEFSPWVAGRPQASGGRGDPSPATARTVFAAIAAAVEIWLRKPDLGGVRVAVQGVGAVGSRLTAMLVEHGARVTIADVDEERARAVASDTGATVAAPEGAAAVT